MPFAPIPDILADLRAGKMVILTDDEDRENEGDIIIPAQFVTPEVVTFMLSKALGYLCLCLSERDCDRLRLHPQGSINTSVRGTAFTISIDLHPSHGGTTGVSAKERAKCILMAIDPRYGPEDFVRPGHVNPLRSRDGGVLVRTGQTEGSVDLCRLAGLYPAAVLLEIMKPDGEMARLPDLEKFAREHNLKMCSVAQIIEHRLSRESLVERLQPAGGRTIHTHAGDFQALLYRSKVDPLPHLVLSKGLDLEGRTPRNDAPTLVRMHRRHLLGDVFGDLASSPDGATCDVLRASMELIQREGRGAIVYLRTSRPGEGDDADLEGRLQSLHFAPASSNDPDLMRVGAGATPSAVQGATSTAQREFGVGGQVLRDLGLTRLRLITRSDRTLPGLDAYGIEIVERVRP